MRRIAAIFALLLLSLTPAFPQAGFQPGFANVVQYGATADGATTQTDNHAAFVKAYNAVVAMGGGIVYIPPGWYCEKTGIVSTNQSVTFLGGGPAFTPPSGGTTVDACGANVTPITINGSNNAIRNMTLKGMNSLSASAPAAAIGSSCVGCRIIDSETWYGTGLRALGSDGLVENHRAIQSYGISWISGPARIVNSKGNNSWSGGEPSAPITISAWAGTTAYTLNQLATLAQGGHTWQIKATVAGTSGGSAPTILPYSSTFTDGSVTWQLYGLATNYGYLCDAGAGCSQAMVTNSDFSGAHTAGIAFIDNGGGVANGGGIITGTTATDNLNYGLLASIGGGLAVQGGSFSCIVSACKPISFEGTYTGPVMLSDLIARGTTGSIAVNLASGTQYSLSGIGAFTPGGTGILLSGVSSVSIVNSNVGANAGWGTNATGINVGSGVSSYHLSSNPCVGVATCLTDAGTGPKSTITNGLFASSANANAIPTSGIPGSVARFTSADNVAARNIIEGFHTAGSANPAFVGAASRGNGGSPAALQTGDIMARLSGVGYGATTYGSVHDGIRIVAAQTLTDSAQGTYLDLMATLNGTTTGVSYARIENDGGITVPFGVTGGSKGSGTINSSGLHYVAGSAIAASATSPLVLNATTGALTCPTCVVTTKQSIGSSTGATLAQNTTDYVGLTGGFQTTQFPISITVPMAGTLRNLVWNAGNSPAAGQTFTATLMTGTYAQAVAGTLAASGLTCQITSAIVQCADNVNSVSIAANSVFSWRIVSSATSGNLVGSSWAVEFDNP